MSSISDSRDELQALIGDDYKLQWIIGQGGMSTVWLADDLVNQREVAIKVLRPEFSDNEEFLSRFQAEAINSEHIDSPNVVHTYDYREVEYAGRTLCFIVMEYVRGESLADVIERKGALPEDQALDILEQAAKGLAVIHSLGMVHRDIKPGNLLVTQDGTVKITDFGIAKAASSVPLTRTGMVVGTAQYVSPEQAQGVSVDSASDIYSLGVVGYEMLTGKRPFTGDSSVSVAIAHINQAPPALPTTISAPTRELIGITLRKDPAARYQTGEELAHAVEAARAGQRPPAPLSTRPRRQAAAQGAPSDATQVVTTHQQPTSQTAYMPTTNAAPAATGYVPTATGTVPQQQQPPAKKKSGGVALGIGAGILVLLVAGAAAIALTQSGNKTGDDTDTTSSTRSTVTEVVPEETAPTYEEEPTITTERSSETESTKTSRETSNERPSTTRTRPSTRTSTSSAVPTAEEPSDEPITPPTGSNPDEGSGGEEIPTIDPPFQLGEGAQ